MKNVQEEIRQAAQHVFDVMAPRVSAEDLQRIKDAFALAEKAHDGQMRKSGIPYIFHPIAVANIAAEELELDANSVMAAFLHDVVEDTPYTIKDIKSRFGDDVAFLVKVLTKIKRGKPRSTNQIDNYKQMLESVNYDVRALLVKLSDRLNNMRTLDSMAPDKQMKIAGETDFFYAPLAGRLGLYHIKSELENLSFRYRCPREYRKIESQLEENREITAEPLKKFTDRVEEILDDMALRFRIQVRYRRPYSVWRDMQEKGCDFSHVEFKHYIRVIYSPMTEWDNPEVLEKNTALFIYSILSSHFKERPGSVMNFIDNPKDNGYQSFHVRYLNPSGCWEEFHIGSERMHVNAKLGCVVERGESWLERFRNVLMSVAQNDDGMMMMEGVKSIFYNENIIAYTPKGKGIILPKGATALDFAYEVHTEIGSHAKFARINGELCPISQELQRGDCVEIGTSPDAHPVEKWLKYAKAYKTKSRVRSYLDRQMKPEFERCPVCHPLPGDEVVGFSVKGGRTILHKRHCGEAIRQASETGDLILSVDFEPDERFTYPVRLEIIAVDRYHLLCDILNVLVEKYGIYIGNMEIRTEDQIVTCDMDFEVHSADEFHEVTEGVEAIDGVEEVKQIEL